MIQQPPPSLSHERALSPGFYAWLMHRQFEINTLASVAIEFPSLQLALARLAGERPGE